MVKDEINEIRRQIQDIRARLPAHSVKPAMLQKLEQLEERLAELEDANRQE
ncbi:MAG: histidine kinase [Bacillota bacterium]|nr:histidine kinase [Bacillota bacterium]MDW7683746.1 histidine kinase [Bacillota bacterium]